MKSLLPLFAVALSAAPAYSQGTPGQEGIWPVESAGDTCAMSQAFSDTDFGRHTLAISYDASRQEVSLTTINAPADELPESGELMWRIVFLDNGRESYDDAWGARRFTYVRDGEAYRFTARFAGEKNVRQILADLAASRGVGFMERGKVVTAFDLAGAARSIGRLRSCAARVVATN